MHPVHRSSGRQLLQLASQLQSNIEFPRVISQAVSLIGGSGTFPWLSSCGGITERPSGREFANVADSSRLAAVPGVEVISPEQHSTTQNNYDIISKELTKGPAEFPFPVQAFYLGAKIDVAGLRTRAQKDKFPTHYHKNDSTLICLRKGRMLQENQYPTGLPLETYLMAFSYGSVVVFNPQSDLLVTAILQMCREHVAQPLPSSEQYMEESMIRIRPEMEAWSVHSPEHIKLQRLDWSNMRVISAVLGQSVALDYYARNVERMLDTFVTMNLQMHKTGNLSDSIGKDELLRLVAQNNLILTDIITKLGLLDYYDIAWKTSQYGRIWEYMRREFDVEARFETIEDKLKLVQENLKYFLELMQHKKSDTLEWTIIILIAAEILISLYEMAARMGLH